MKALLLFILLTISTLSFAQSVVVIPPGDTATLSEKLIIKEVHTLVIYGTIVFDHGKLILPEGSRILIMEGGMIVGRKHKGNKIKIGKDVVWKGNPEIRTVGDGLSEGTQGFFLLKSAEIIMNTFLL